MDSIENRPTPPDHFVSDPARTEEAIKETVERIGADAPRARFIARAMIVLVIWTALHLGILGALAAGAIPGGWWTIFALFALILASMGAIFAGIRYRSYPGALRRVFVYRSFWYAQMSLLLLSPVGAAAFAMGLPFGRGVLWARAALAVEVLLVVGVFIAGWLGTHRLVARALQLKFPDLPRSFDGFTIAQLTDTHVGPHTNRRFLARAANAVIDAKPNLVVFTGDQVDDFHEDVRHFTAAFGRLPNAYAVLGNHDVYAGWKEVRDGLEQAGIKVLVNDSIALERGGEKIWLAGTGDPAAGQRFIATPHEAAPDIPRTLSRVPKGAFVVALAHNPALWAQLTEKGVQLTLSGHTHHGQVSIPWLKWSVASVFLELAMGLYERGSSKLYIAPGTNFWGLPLRLGAWPEVTILRLSRG